MALSEQQITDALTPAVTAIAEGPIRLGQRYERGHDEQGNNLADPPPFVRVKSPDGSIWRLKVSNTGAVTATKE